MIEKPWLTKELDNKPFTYDEEKLNNFIEQRQIYEAKQIIDHELSNDEKLREKVIPENYKQTRRARVAKNFMKMENPGIDIMNLTKYEKENLEAYYKALQMSVNFAKDENFYLDDRAMVMIHCQVFSKDIDQKQYCRYRLRNAMDEKPLIGKGYFEPVDGEDVNSRISSLLYDYEETWKNDNIFARGAKFVSEYVRIQPHLQGNKRVALIILNYTLLKNGYPDIYFDKEQLNDLYDCLKESILTRDVTNFACLIAKNVSNYYHAVVQRIEDVKVDNFLKKTNDNIKK
jgi:prophage maintenance system killer protein